MKSKINIFISILLVLDFGFSEAQQHTFALDFDNGRGTNDRAVGIAADSNGIDLLTLTTCTFGEFGACSGPTRIDNQGEIQYHKLYRYNLMGTRHVIRTFQGDMILPGQRQFIGEPRTATFSILSPEGDSVLMKNYFIDAESSIAHAAYELNDSLYILQGTINSMDVSSPFVLIVDGEGNVIEEHIYAGLVQQAIWGNMTPLSTGEWMLHYVVQPLNSWPAWINYVFLVKLSADFEVIWTKQYYKTSGLVPIYLYEIPDDRYLLVGHVDSFEFPYGRGNVALHILDTAGQVLEDHRLFQGSELPHLFIIPDGKGNFIGAGEKGTEVPGVSSERLLPWIVRFNEKGEKFWEYQFVWKDPMESFWVEDLTMMPDGRVAFCGHVRVESGTPGDSYVIVVDSTGCLRPDKGCPDYLQWVVQTTASEPVAVGSFELHVWPNPASDEVHIHWDVPDVVIYSLYDMHGRLLYHSTEVPQGEKLFLPTRSYPLGMYIVKATSSQGVTIQKTLILSR